DEVVDFAKSFSQMSQAAEALAKQVGPELSGKAGQLTEEVARMRKAIGQLTAQPAGGEAMSGMEMMVAFGVLEAAIPDIDGPADEILKFWLVAKAGKAGSAVGAKSAAKGGGAWFHKTLRGMSRAVGFRKGSQVAGGGVQGAATGAAASSSAGWLMDKVLGHTAGLAQATSRGAHKLEAVVGRLTQGAGKVTGKAGAFTPQVFLRDLKFAD